MEKYSMKFTPPLTLLDKKLRIEEKVNEIQNKRDKITIRISEICAELSDFNNEVRGNRLEEERYQFVLKEQSRLKKEKNTLERLLMPIKEEMRELSQEEGKIKAALSKIPMDEIQEKLLEMRDTYLSFAADPTRVRSMKDMASKFVEEIQSVLKYFK